MASRLVAVITGAATGVGAASARWFAARGYDVLINYRASSDAAAAVAAECRAAGADAVTVQGDVAEDADCRRVADIARERWGAVAVLINSAGTTLFRPMADLEALDAADFARIFAVRDDHQHLAPRHVQRINHFAVSVRSGRRRRRTECR